MHWLGLAPSTLAALGLLGAAALVALYLLRLRRRSVVVVFSGLWESAAGDAQASVRASRLRQALSLLLQLLLLLALVLALGDPRLGRAEAGTRRVLLVDTSASMRRTDVRPTRLDEAKRLAREFVEDLGTEDETLVVALGPVPTPVGALTTDRAELARALDAVRQTDAPADLAEGLRFAKDVLAGASGQAEIVLFSDAAFPARGPGDAAPVELGDVTLRLVPVGAEPSATAGATETEQAAASAGRDAEGSGAPSAPDAAARGSWTEVAVTAFAARRYPRDPARAELHLALDNRGAEDAEVDVELRADERLIGRSRERVPARGTRRLTYADVAGVGEVLTARLLQPTAGAPSEHGTEDERETAREAGATSTALAEPAEGAAPSESASADQTAYVVLPPRARPRVLVVTAGNLYLEAALLLDESVEATFVKPDALRPEGAFDVALFDGVAPAWARELPAALYLDVPETGGPIERAEPLALFGFDDWKRDHPVLRGLAMENIQVLEGHRLVPGPGDVTLGASTDGQLLVSGEREGQRFLALGFDPRRSDMVLRPAFPLFVLAALRELARAPAAEPAAFVTGETWAVALPEGRGLATITAPDGRVSEAPVVDGVVRFRGELAGVYALTAPTAEARAPRGAPDEAAPAGASEGAFTRRLIAANRGDAGELGLSARKDLPPGYAAGAMATGLPETNAASRHELWMYLLAAVVLVAAVEWVTYHRRLTV